MLPKFQAFLDGEPGRAGARPLNPGLSRHDFDCGAIAVAPGVSYAADGPFVCAAYGAPRFPRPPRELATDAEARAWIEAFRHAGRAAANHVKGRFAVVVIDLDKRACWAATDRFGTQPICYADRAGVFGIANRADSVPGASREIDRQAIFDYLYFHAIPAPRTIFAGVRRLDAGHDVHFLGGKLNTERYWHFAFAPDDSADLDAYKREFVTLVRQSVEHDVADGRHVGAYLSGGTDSSTVAGMLGRVLGHPAPTYSIGFDARGYDEMEYARIAARHFGTDHHEYYVTPEDLVAGIPAAAAHFDQPFGNSSVVPSWICARNARDDGLDMLLAGDGGDELFGGNSRYAKQRVFEWYGLIPDAFRNRLLEPALMLPLAGRIPLTRKAASYVEQARVPLPDRAQMYNLLHRLGVENVFTGSFLEQIDLDEPLVQQRAHWDAVRTPAKINHMLAFEWKYTLADNDLPKVEAATQLAGIDVAYPLLSDELVDFSLRLPPDWKLKGLTLRWFFKEALKDFLPAEIIAKKKHGFGLPFGVWATQHPRLRALAADSLATFAARGIVRKDFLTRLTDELLPAHPGYYGEMVWILMMLEQWLRAQGLSSSGQDFPPGAALVKDALTA